MKKILLTLAGFIVVMISVAQSPNLLNYQGVARNAVGNVLPSQPVGLRLSILSNSPTGAVVYSETRNVTTNAFGLFNVQVGSPGAITTTGSIAGINWTAFGAGSGTKFLQVEIDPIGGTNYFNVGSTQLVSVPYALNAGASAPVGPAGGDLTGSTYPNPVIAPLVVTTGKIADGAVTTVKLADNSVTTPKIVDLNVTTGKIADAAVTTIKLADNSVTTPKIVDLNVTTAKIADAAVTTIKLADGAVTSQKITFPIIKTQADAGPLFQITNTGAGNSIEGINTGTGRGGYFVVNNAANTSDAIRAETNGSGTSWGIRGISSGTNGAGLFQQTNTTNTANNLQSNQAGLGRSALFNATNAANASNALEVNMAGTGFAASFINTNATPKALRTTGALQFTGINEGPGRIMVTLDGTGNANWQSAASVGLVSGSGTLNYVPKWTPDGVTIGNSQIFDNGTNIGIGSIFSNVKLNISSPSSLEFPLYAGVNGTGNKFAMNKDGQLYIRSTKPGPFTNTGNFAVVVDGQDQGMVIRLNGKPYPDKENQYITFIGADNVLRGRIEGQSLADLHNDPKYIWDAAMGGLDVAFPTAESIATGFQLDFFEVGTNAVQAIVAGAKWAEFFVFSDVNAGIVFQSGSADYAEWLEKINADEKFSFGDIVGVNGGKISKITEGAEKIMVVSMAPIVLGNMPAQGKEKYYEKVAFMGQVPVKVRGAANAGDYILASGMNDGWGFAIHSDKMTLADYKRVVGVAWGSAQSENGFAFVKTAVGINSNDLVGKMMKQQSEIEEIKNTLNNLTAYLKSKDTAFKADHFTINSSAGNISSKSSETLAKPTPLSSAILSESKLKQADIKSIDERNKAITEREINRLITEKPELLRQSLSRVKAIYDAKGFDYSKIPELQRMFNDEEYFFEQVRKAFKIQ